MALTAGVSLILVTGKSERFKLAAGDYETDPSLSVESRLTQ
jgi:hypothetical protein